MDRYKSNLTPKKLHDEVVISGMSGSFPASRNISEFEHKLYNKVNMIESDRTRWKNNGKILNVDEFDPTIFGVQQSQADYMDPLSRLLLQEAFKAIMDAGLNPLSLRGSNIGVYVGNSYSEAANDLLYNENIPSGFALTGCSRAMFPNRISFILGLQGPSLLCDASYSSSLYALDLAYNALLSGECDAAIVGASNLCLYPKVDAQFKALNLISPTGKCSPFDDEANGYLRSEAACCIFLQRKSEAKRVYATILNCQTSCSGFTPDGITFPSAKLQEDLLRSCYSNANIDPDDLGYWEASASGVLMEDIEECKAIDNVVCVNRKDKLLIGSVKSNCGHTESVAGLTSLVKVLLAMQNNTIPPNINYKKSNQAITAIVKGRLKVVNETIDLHKPYVGVSSASFTGVSGHVILKQFNCENNLKKNIFSSLPRLVLWSSRTEENLNEFLSSLENKPIHEEYLALAQSAQTGGITGMMFRGYTILQAENANGNASVLNKVVQHNSGIKSPLVWVFSGMGSQWPAMGKSLMQIPIFSKSIQGSHNILKTKGLDLIQIITSTDPNTINNILHTFVGICAIQIALVDVLRELRLTPDYIIGHSVGELGCAYADGCFTAEEMILAAYYRGKVSAETEKIKGSMAAIGMGYDAIKSILPEKIDVACYNSPDSCTISGPSEDVALFVDMLKAKKIFAREVPSSNIAYHSRYISHLGPKFLKYLQGVISSPKPRSSKWISTSVPKSRWFDETCKYSSAEYHTNNLLSSVHFEEASKYLPSDAITIEIAPHALLQSILKNALPKAVHVGLARRNANDHLEFFLNALGSLYLNGLELDIGKLYPEIKWPVSRGTPTLSSAIDFDRSRKFYVSDQNSTDEGTGVQLFKISLNDEKYSYLRGHKIDGRIIIPGAFYCICVWQSFATSKGAIEFESVAIEMENVRLMRQVYLSEGQELELVVEIQKGSGKFEITESESLIASGFIREARGSNKPLSKCAVRRDDELLNSNDFYREMNLRGYGYGSVFQLVEVSSYDGSYSKIKWHKNWVALLDCFLQSSVKGDFRNPKVLTSFRYCKLDNASLTEAVRNTKTLEVFEDFALKRRECKGIEFRGLTMECIQFKKIQDSSVMEIYKFVPHFPAPKLSPINVAKCCLQVILENYSFTNVKIVEAAAKSQNIDLLKILKETIEKLPLITGEYYRFDAVDPITSDDSSDIVNIYYADELEDKSIQILLMTQDAEDTMDFDELLQRLDPKGFVIIRRETLAKLDETVYLKNFEPIGIFPSDSETFILLHHKKQSNPIDKMQILKISSADHKFQWIQKLQTALKSSQEVLVVSENDSVSGVLGLVNCLLKEPESRHVRCVFIDDPKAPPFDINNPFYAQQLQLQLAINVYRKGSWGTYRHLDLPEEHPQTTPSGHVAVSMPRIGDISSLRWIEGPVVSDDHQIKVVYTSLNFHDVMVILGQLAVGWQASKNFAPIGLEFSGIEIKTNKPVMGMNFNPSISSSVNGNATLSWEVPKNWTLEEAATVPGVYLIVYYAFFYTADIRKGKSILIHAGSGGIGIAAIRVATAYGLEVYTTVSTPEKKAFLLKTFPTLNEKNIGNSLDTSFEEMIVERTNGKGVDFVLNSLSEDKMKASLRCLGKRGKFLEIGKFDMTNENSIGLGSFLKELSFHAILLDNLQYAKKDLVNAIHQHISEDIVKGIIKPLPATTFKAHELEQSFRCLMDGKLIGKVLLQIRDSSESDVTLPITVLPQVYFSSDSVYIVLGGLGQFGMELVDWMILKGARKILLTSNSDNLNSYQKYKTSIWQSSPCNVVITNLNTRSSEGCMNLLMEAKKLGNIDGIFNLAFAIRDSPFLNQTPEMFEQSFLPKAITTKYLDEISRRLCPDLKYFVVFSSVSCGRGTAGQTNYGMANSIIERIIENRVSNGYPGTAIQWGALKDDELVEMAGGIEKSDIRHRTISSLNTLDALLCSGEPVVSSTIVAKQKLKTPNRSPADFVMAALSIDDIYSVPVDRTLEELGLDSLMAIEIKQNLECYYGISFNASDILTSTLSNLEEMCDNMIRSLDTENQVEKVDDETRMIYGHIETNSFSSNIFESANKVSEDVPIIILTGFDGISGEAWKKFGSLLSSPAYVLQILKNYNTIDDIANYAYENIMRFLKETRSSKFQIVAYSFGTLIAHSAIERLEEAGYTGKAVYIAGTPTLLESIGRNFLCDGYENEIEKTTIAVVLNLIMPRLSQKEIENDLSDKDGKADLMSYLKGKLRDINYGSLQNIIDLIERCIVNLNIVKNPKNFQTIGIVKTPILLVKCRTPIIDELDEFYGLAMHTEADIEIISAEGNHYSIVYNKDVPLAVNNFFQNR